MSFPETDRLTTVTLTFCDCGENHIDNQTVGKRASAGLSTSQVRALAGRYEDSELIELNQLLDDPEEGADACVLIIRNLAAQIVGDSFSLLRILLNLSWDTKGFSRRHNRVVNKHARSNLIFAETSQPPCYEEGRGTIVAFDEIPSLRSLKDNIHEHFIADNFDEEIHLVAEGNLYTNNARQGIGWHGDAERKIVVGVRLGASMPLKFAWFHNGAPVSKSVELMLNHGDIYVLSAEAVGTNWKRRSAILYVLHDAKKSIPDEHMRFIVERNDLKGFHMSKKFVDAATQYEPPAHPSFDISFAESVVRIGKEGPQLSADELARRIDVKNRVVSDMHF